MRSFRSSNTLVYLDAKCSFEEIEQGKNSHLLSQLTDTFRVASIVKNKHSGNEKPGKRGFGRTARRAEGRREIRA
ncbi:hypothetical protein R1flu_011186 [Riccia fluitans]|uniref:Ribosomal protein L4 n=1 Tax=Riccia fluitans TaxID=41844 RepID=A0ABD1Z863_9MARC